VHADPPSRTIGWRLWALGPVLLLAAVVGLFVSSGSSLVDLIGHNPPPADEVDIRRVELRQGEVRIHVTNPQSDAVTVALVTVDDAIVPFTTEGPRKVKRLRSTTIVVHYNWVRDEPLSVGVTSSTGIQTTKEIAAAVETPRATAQGFFIATVYAVRLSYLALAQTAEQTFEGAGGVWEIGEMALAHEVRDLILPTAIFARWSRS